MNHSLKCCSLKGTQLSSKITLRHNLNEWSYLGPFLLEGCRQRTFFALHVLAGLVWDIEWDSWQNNGIPWSGTWLPRDQLHNGMGLFRLFVMYLMWFCYRCSSASSDVRMLQSLRASKIPRRENSGRNRFLLVQWGWYGWVTSSTVHQLFNCSDEAPCFRSSEKSRPGQSEILEINHNKSSHEFTSWKFYNLPLVPHH